MVTNLHIYPSPFKFESRILREANTLLTHKLVDRVIIASGWAPGLKKEEFVQDKVQVKRFWTLSDYLIKYHRIFLVSKYLELYAYIFFYYLFKPISTINAHSLMVLPIAVALKIFKNKQRVIYDAHELETERFGLKGKPQQFSKILERKLIKYCDGIIVVGEHIRKWYINEYNLSPEQIYTVRNINDADSKIIPKNDNYLKRHFSLAENDIIFIYQGLLSEGRGINTYIEAFKNLPPNFNLVFMGYGPLENEIKIISKNCKNIFYHEAVKPNEIIGITSSADVGLCLIENYCLSYYYSLPNKLFEYTSSGLPVICSNFPEMNEIVTRNQIGWTIHPVKDELVNLIKSENFIREKKLNREQISTFINSFNWTNEQTQLVLMYRYLNH